MKFATLINFTDQGFKNVHETTDRAAAFVASADKAGVRITELLWLSGRYDGLVVFEAADVETASSVMLQLSKSGFVTTETMPAFDTDAMKILTAT